MDLAEQRRRREYVRAAFSRIDRQIERMVLQMNEWYQERLELDYQLAHYKGEVTSDHD